MQHIAFLNFFTDVLFAIKIRSKNKFIRPKNITFIYISTVIPSNPILHNNFGYIKIKYNYYETLH